MKKILFCLLFLSVSLNNAVALTKAENQKSYQVVLNQRIATDVPGVAVIVTQNGQVLFKGARGLANVELGIPLTTDHVFRLGSITKQFTAAAIMMLQEQNKLNINDDIHKYVPDFPTEGNKVTIENLLTHTSGIANYTEDGDLFQKEIQVPTDIDQMLTRFSKHPMPLKTGVSMRYSNTGYVLLGKIIEVASDQTYADFIETHIFKKLGMKSSRYGGSQIIPNRASGYDMSPNGVVNASYIDMMWPHAAGSLLSTVDDLDLWFKALRSGKLLTKESYQKMIQPFKLNDGSLSNYGFGLGISKLNKYHAISHSGGIPGFSTNAIYIPSEDLYVAVLSNLSSRNSSLISQLLVAEALDIPVPKFNAVKPNLNKLKQLEGEYKIGKNSIRKFIVEDGKTFTQRDDGQKYEVTAMSENSFYYPSSLSYFVIEPNQKEQQVMKFYSLLGIEPQLAIKQ